MKKTLLLSFFVLFVYGAFAQTQTRPEMIYSISGVTLDCANNKVCYTVAVRTDIDGDYFFDGATFRYLVDPTIFQQPVVGDHSTLPTNGLPYNYSQQAVEQPIIGTELGFGQDQTYWVKGTLASTAPTIFPRTAMSTTPVDIMTICLTAVEDLDATGAPSNLCYPFVFDENHISPDNGILPNTEGLQSSYTEVANVDNGVGQAYAGLDNADQYLWEPNPSWDGTSITNEPFGTVGSIATTGCITNVCAQSNPVELIDFTAVAHGLDSDLSWRTASEENSSHFEIERSIDGVNFERISVVESLSVEGMSSSELSYGTQDKNAAGWAFQQNASSVYYRIKQVDLNGEYAYTMVRIVDFSEVEILESSIFPNPSVGGQDVVVLSNSIEKVEVYTLQGELVQVVEELNEQRATSINTSELAKGVYMVVINGNETKKLIVQ